MSRKTLFPVFVILITFSPWWELSLAAEADLDFILRGIEEVGCNGCGMGMMTAFGENSFSFLSTSLEGGRHPLATGAHYGQGRFIGYGQDNFLNPTTTDGVGQTHDLLLNSINWVIQGSSAKRCGVLMGTDWAIPLNNLLNQNGFFSQLISKEVLTNPTNLEVILLPDVYDIETTHLDSLKQFVRNGGGIVAGCTTWIYPEWDYRVDFVGNDLIRDMGLAWVPRYTYPTSNNGQYNASRLLLEDTHALNATLNLVASISSRIQQNNDSETLQQWGGIVAKALEAVHPTQLPMMNELKDSLLSLVPLSPAEDSPIPSTPENNFIADMEIILYEVLLSPEEIGVHPSAAFFPGVVESSNHQCQDKNNRVTINVNRELEKSMKNHYKDSIELYRRTKLKQLSRDGPEIQAVHYDSHWYSTGLYAPAGTLITVTVQSSSETVTGFQVRIGVHQDDLKNKASWKRFPRISKRSTFTGTSGIIASPFGGLVYLQNLRTIGDSQIINVTLNIAGAVLTPSFTLGITSLVDWREIVRHIRAPWAEFISERITLSIPGDLASSVDDPEDLMAFWLESVNYMSDLIGERRDESFQRVTFDMDISAGYMHSGYPIMAMLPSAPHSVNLTRMRLAEGDSWGFFHELGHNHQRSSWTLEGGGEVTCNIFVMYVMTTLSGIKLEDTRPDKFHPENMIPMLEDFIDAGATYPELLKDPFLHLFYYFQLQKLVGWQIYKDIFAVYRDMSDDDDEPITEQEKRDTWMIILSQVLQRNLAPHMKSWGFPISPLAEANVTQYPDPGYRMTDLLNTYKLNFKKN